VRWNESIGELRDRWMGEELKTVPIGAHTYFGLGSEMITNFRNFMMMIISNTSLARITRNVYKLQRQGYLEVQSKEREDERGKKVEAGTRLQRTRRRMIQ
jgi:hypothetical protein